MNILKIIKYILFCLAIVLLFINWKISIIVWLVAVILHTIPFGPNTLLSVITGILIIAGVIYIFIDWKIGVLLFGFGILATRFRVWANKKNIDYYKKFKKN